MAQRVRAASFLMAIAAPASALAQSNAPQTGTQEVQPAATPGAPDQRRVYQAAYFVRYAPSTALEIVQRTPGFTLEKVDDTVRGFGQAAGNVVINGQRPSSKTDTLEDILGRIPASRVLRVEVGPGDLYGADYASKPQVLNLVLSAGGGMAGTLEGAVRRDFTGQVLPQGSASVLLHHGKSTFNAAVTVTNEQTSEEGYDRVIALPSGDQLEYRRKTNVLKEPTGAISGSWEYDGGANRTAHVNLRAGTDRFSLTQSNHVIPTGAPERDDRLTERYRTDTYEIGGDITRPFAGGGLKLLGLASRRDRLNRDLSLTGVDVGTTGGAAQTLDDHLDERLARLTWTRPKLLGWSVETGIEGVVNKLDSANDLFTIDADGNRTRIDLPIDNATVKEVRGEGFVNAGRQFTKKLRLDLGLTYEASHLTVSGDATAKRTLQFLKPKATLDWHPSQWHLQLAVQRIVAQLQFEDFISTAKLSDGQVSGGNAGLEPQRAWESLLTIERPILGDGLIKTEIGYNRVSKVQDLVPVAGGFDAPGNLGSGNVYILRQRIEAPLTKFGIKGGRLTLYGSYVKTSVQDPYTLRDRPFSGNSLFYGEITFRQDLDRFAWGFYLEGVTPAVFYRRTEVDSNPRGFPTGSAFVEYRPDKKTTFTFTIDNVADVPGYRRRTFYDPDRTNPDPFLREFRLRNQHFVPSISFKRSFG